jgi:hypothetical protein
VRYKYFKLNTNIYLKRIWDMNPCTVGSQQDIGSGFDGSVLCYCGTEPARPHVNCDAWPMQINVKQTEKEVFI